jgi:dipeptidyl-peptidase-4
MNKNVSNETKMKLLFIIILAVVFALISCHAAKPAKTSAPKPAQAQPSAQTQPQEQVQATLAEPLSGMPGYSQYQKMSGQMRGVVGSASATWADNGKAVEYVKGNIRYRYDMASQKATEIGPVPQEPNAPGRGGRGMRGDGAGMGGRRGTVTEANAPARGDRGTRGVAAGERGGVGTRGRAGGGGGRGFGMGGRGSASFARAGEVMGGGGIARSQTTSARSPDGKYNAYSSEGNLYISGIEGEPNKAITTKGSIKDRLRYGIATIIYGEELGMTGGIFWSQDSKKLAYYGFDESKVKDYYVLLNQVSQYDRLETDTYPKAGTISPDVYLYIYDVNSGKTVEVDVRDGKPFEDSVLGYYVYRIYWSTDGKELLFSRMNRKQNTIELVAANPETGKCRVIFHDEWPTGWVTYSPFIRFLADGNRFILASERTGFRNYYLYDLSGKLITPLTFQRCDVGNIVDVNEKTNSMYYMSRDGSNFMKQQLHRVSLDGKIDKRLTDPKFNHSVSLSADGKYFIDTYQTHDVPPATRLVDSEGNPITELSASDLTRFNELGLKKVEMFTYLAGDGKTGLYGMLHFPSNFDPKKKYPVLLSVYGGPSRSNSPTENFTTPSAMTEYGFLVVNVEARSYGDRGKALLDSYYGHMGITEMDDIANGVKALFNRPYVDKTKVGVFGTSYGGTTAATLLMRYPDVFAAASSSSPVTDYRNYNNIYSERYNGLVSENKDGYDKATIMTYAENLKGRLLLYYGTADNNVHVSNSMQLIQALTRAGKSFEVQVGPDAGHTGVAQNRMMEFFIENLVLKK